MRAGSMHFLCSKHHPGQHRDDCDDCVLCETVNSLRAGTRCASTRISSAQLGLSRAEAQ